MRDQRIPIALMGLGWVGTHRHAVAITKNPDFRLTGVIDRNPEKASALGKRLGVRCCQAERLEDIPWINEAKALAVATPPATHFELVSDAISMGLDVLTEKPFAMKPEQGKLMADLAEQKGRVLAVVHNFQFSRSALMLRRDFDLGKFGKIHRIHAVQLSNPKRRLPVWYETLPGGLFYDESPHLLYLMQAFSTSPLQLEQASVVSSNEGCQTPEIIQARYSSRTTDGQIFPVTLDMHFSAPLSEWHFAVLGEHAMGVVDIFRDIYLCLPNDGLHTTKTVLRTSVSATVQHWLQHFSSGIKHLAGTLDYGNNEVYRRFALSIRNRLPPVGINSSAALAVLRMQDQLLEYRS